MDGVKVKRLKPYLKSGNAAFVPAIWKELNGFDIVHLHYPFFGVAELVWLKKILDKKMKLVIHYHMDVLGLSWPAKILSIPDKLIRHNLFKRAGAVICATRDYFEHGDLRTVLSQLGDRFHELPFGVDIGGLQPNDKTANQTLKLLFVGGLDQAHHFKGIEVLLRALEKLEDQDWSLDIIGSGNLLSQYQEQATHMGLGEKVKFLGRVEDLRQHYQSADVFVLPSTARNEAFGLVLIEAMASGTAVIASALPGVRRVFEDGVQGFLVQPNNADDLAQKISYAIAHRDEIARMGEAGRKLAEEKYDWEGIIERLEVVYGSL